MDKPFLLIAGDNHCHGAGTDDWIDFYASEEEIKSIITPIKRDVVYHVGKNKGEIAYTKNTYEIMLNENFVMIVDWYEIVDVRTWTSFKGIE